MGTGSREENASKQESRAFESGDIFSGPLLLPGTFGRQSTRLSRGKLPHTFWIMR
jgi:hypothetical protein